MRGQRCAVRNEVYPDRNKYHWNLDLVGLDFSDYLANVPYYTLYYFEIYRILTSIFMSNSIISGSLCGSFSGYGSAYEQQMGSAAFGWMLYASAIAINVVFVALCLVGSMFDKHAMLAECSGFWSVLFTLITLDCLAMPDQPRRLLCIPVDIPGTYFPSLCTHSFASLEISVWIWL